MTRLGLLAGVLSVVALAEDGGAPAGFVRVKQGSEVWRTGVPRFPPAVPVAVLDGDPSKAGPFTVRLKLPKGTRLAPHTHPADERTTVLSGVVLVGAGTTTDAAKLVRLEAGGFYVNPKNAPHTLQVEQDAVLQVAADGPWSVSPVK